MTKTQDNKNVSPFAGGCWFCFKKNDTMEFSCEFDTMVHIRCIKRALAVNSKHNEAKIMAKEFEIKL